MTVANLVMEEVGERALATFDPPPRFWKRYVDDTCTALPAVSVTSFHHHLNSIDTHIQFTVEEEMDHSIPFLDVLLTHHEDGMISTSVFRKPTHTSHHPMAHKVSVIRTLYKRARTLSSSPLQCTEEEKHIAQALKRNSYPTRLIRTTRLHLLSHCQDKQRDKERPEPCTGSAQTVPCFVGTGCTKSLGEVFSVLECCSMPNTSAYRPAVGSEGCHACYGK